MQHGARYGLNQGPILGAGGQKTIREHMDNNNAGLQGASGTQRTWAAQGEDNVAAVQNFAASRSRYTFFVGATSRPNVVAAGLPEVVFKGKGTKTKLNLPKGVTVQWTPKGSYRDEEVVNFIRKNLRPGEKITPETPWRLLFLLLVVSCFRLGHRLSTMEKAPK